MVLRPLSVMALALIGAVVMRADARMALPDLPIIVLPVEAPHGTMAVFYSGDGGWRKLDRSIARSFQREGVPTVGMDSLHYFWSRKTRKRTSADLARIIDQYSRRWHANRIVLVGYSFGADVLPAAFNHLPPLEKSKVAEVSLLGPSYEADYEIRVGGFLGLRSGGIATLPDISEIRPSLLQCFYGAEEGFSPCQTLRPGATDLIQTAGGHHFGGDYEGLAKRILAGLDRRDALPPTSVPAK